MNLQDALTALTPALEALHRDDVTIEPRLDGEGLNVTVRSTDVDAVRGFDVVAEPLPAEERSPEDLARDVAAVVERELGYGQLAARGEDGTFKRIVV